MEHNQCRSLFHFALWRTVRLPSQFPCISRRFSTAVVDNPVHHIRLTVSSLALTTLHRFGAVASQQS